MLHKHREHPTVGVFAAALAGGLRAVPYLGVLHLRPVEHRLDVHLDALQERQRLRNRLLVERYAVVRAPPFYAAAEHQPDDQHLRRAAVDLANVADALQVLVALGDVSAQRRHVEFVVAQRVHRVDRDHRLRVHDVVVDVEVLAQVAAHALRELRERQRLVCEDAPVVLAVARRLVGDAHRLHLAAVAVARGDDGLEVAAHGVELATAAVDPISVVREVVPRAEVAAGAVGVDVLRERVLHERAVSEVGDGK